ncbi:hypothetical protein SVIOM342S_03162 [Streptomyces violaceorubidus]
MAHDPDHVGEPLLDVLASVPGGQSRGERLDRPAQFAQLAALVVALRAEGTPFDDVRIQEVPVTDGTHPGTDIGAGADQPLRLQHAEGLTHYGAGDLEALSDLLGHQWAVCTQVAGNDHLAKLLDELPVQSAATVARGAPAHAAQLGLHPFPGGRTDAVDGGRLRVRVAVEFARVREAGVGGTGGGHHGVRKGTHASFVGARPNSLEVFGEKHTKG